MRYYFTANNAAGVLPAITAMVNAGVAFNYSVQYGPGGHNGFNIKCNQLGKAIAALQYANVPLTNVASTNLYYVGVCVTCKPIS